jgi:hypothetical protein
MLAVASVLPPGEEATDTSDRCRRDLLALQPNRATRPERMPCSGAAKLRSVIKEQAQVTGAKIWSSRTERVLDPWYGTFVPSAWGELWYERNLDGFREGFYDG